MTDRRPCVRCERPIDRYAKSCVYCAWDQSQTYTPQPASVSGPVYVPPPDNRARNRLLMIAGGVALIILAFCIGTWIHGFEPNEVKAAQGKEIPQTASAAPAPAAQRSNVTLVPTNEGPPTEIEEPLTSAPPQAPGQEASDATALPSDEYAAMAARAKTQKVSPSAMSAIDPRAVRGGPYEEPPPRPRSTPAPAPAPAGNVPMASSVTRTAAYPEYKPLPHIYVSHDTSARLNLTVGADGRVKDIDIVDPIPGATGKLIQAVQTWRFKPATENGVPVTGRVAVTIILHANG